MAVQQRITAVGARAARKTPGRPWENGFIEAFNALTYQPDHSVGAITDGTGSAPSSQVITHLSASARTSSERGII